MHSLFCSSTMFFAVLESWASGHSARNAVSRISENQESPKNQAREEFLLTTGCSEDTPKNPYESKRPFWPPKPPLRGCSKQNNPCLPAVGDYNIYIYINNICITKLNGFKRWFSWPTTRPHTKINGAKLKTNTPRKYGSADASRIF